MTDFSKLTRAVTAIASAAQLVADRSEPLSVELAGNLSAVMRRLQKEECPEFVLLDEVERQLAIEDDLSLGITRRIRQWCSELPEFATVGGIEAVEVVLTSKVFKVVDGPITRTLLGRAEKSKPIDLETFPNAKPFRLVLSIPYWLVATEAQRSAALHDLMCRFGRKEAKDEALGAPVLRKPTVAVFAATIGRFGVVDSSQAQAVAHAMAHPETKATLREHKFDPVTGQGILWSVLAPEVEVQPDVADDEDELAAAKIRNLSESLRVGRSL